MSIPAQIGKRDYNDAIRRGRNANHNARRYCKRIIEETSSNLIRALIANVLTEIGENEDAINRLDEIGKTLKS